jgi:hypothetical protein
VVLDALGAVVDWSVTDGVLELHDVFARELPRLDDLLRLAPPHRAARVMFCADRLAPRAPAVPMHDAGWWMVRGDWPLADEVPFAVGGRRPLRRVDDPSRSSPVEPSQAVQIPEDDLGIAATALDPTGHEHPRRTVAERGALPGLDLGRAAAGRHPALETLRDEPPDTRRVGAVVVPEHVHDVLVEPPFGGPRFLSVYLGDDVTALEAAVVPHHLTQPVRPEYTPKLLYVLHVLTQRAAMVSSMPTWKKRRACRRDRFGIAAPCQ